MKWIIITVAYFIVCVYKCSAKSINDIEEFSEFLLKTSQLDQILKKGNDPDDDFDEDEPVSDHAWEISGKFEGDLILNERQRRLIVENVAEGLSRNGLKDSTKKWPDNEVVYYIQREHFSSDQVQAIQSGIDDLAGASCVKFRPYKKGDRDAVVIQGSRRGCFSQVGYQSGYQVLNLSGRHPVGRGCFRHGTVVHELLHTLGFYHMQSSPDRDDYIDVKWENIIEPARHNFRKYNSFAVSDFGVGYDYDSVLHYSRRAFSANGRDTLVPKQGGASIGQRVGLSDKDAKKLNKMYCDADSNNYEAEEETTQKSVTKKKSPKNKPFEGHGIGYHQGKTVVIKLPAVETYKLPNLPTFHVFDYFSKTPQTVPSTLIEGFGKGKEIEYFYKPATTANADEEYNKIATQDKTSDNKIKEEDTEDNHKKVKESKGPYENRDYDQTKIYIKPYESSDNISGNGDDDLNEAFERLGKIIKTHVYPSHTPNFDIYKTKYNHYYEPAEKYDPNPKQTKSEDAYLSASLSEATDDKRDANIKAQTQKSPPHFILNVYSEEKSHDDATIEEYEQDGETSSPKYNKQTSKDSILASVPLHEMTVTENDKPATTEEYATNEPLKYKHSSLYHLKTNNNSDSPNRTLFGYVLPLKGDWYKLDQYKQTKQKDIRGIYFKPNGDDDAIEYHSNDSPMYRYDVEGEKQSVRKSIASDNQAYLLFDVLDPLSKSWYKDIDYDPHKDSYSIENSKLLEGG